MGKFFAIIALIAASAFTGSALAGDVYVQGHTRSDGSYVQPHYRSAPDGNPNNNWSTQGNVNPYTGQAGTRQPDSLTSSLGGSRRSNSNPYGSSYENNGD